MYGAGVRSDFTDADYEVLEGPRAWRIRFWPTLFFWMGVVGVMAAALDMLPGADEAGIAATVLMAAMISPVLRMFTAAFSALSGRPLSEQEVALQRRRLSGRAPEA